MPPIRPVLILLDDVAYDAARQQTTHLASLQQSSLWRRCSLYSLHSRRTADWLQIFHGDLDFYFGGWDGRSRIANIDTNACPVYMLTGEYDWSNTPEMSQKTADKIKGAKHKTMPNLGHFPATVGCRVGYHEGPIANCNSGKSQGIHPTSA